jgi:hypothetical protein
VFKYLSAKNLLPLRLVCRQWRHIIKFTPVHIKASECDNNVEKVLACFNNIERLETHGEDFLKMCLQSNKKSKILESMKEVDVPYIDFPFQVMTNLESLVQVSFLF